MPDSGSPAPLVNVLKPMDGSGRNSHALVTPQATLEQGAAGGTSQGHGQTHNRECFLSGRISSGEGLDVHSLT